MKKKKTIPKKMKFGNVNYHILSSYEMLHFIAIYHVNFTEWHSVEYFLN